MGFRKCTGTTDQIVNILRIIGRAREFQKNIYFHFIDNIKAFDSVGEKFLKRWFGAFPGAFGLGRAQPQRRGTSP